MVHRSWRSNPWSIPLVLAGLAFTLTATAYAVMAVQRLNVSRVPQETNPSPWLIEFLDRHGAALMIVELAILAIVVAAAIASDRWQFGGRKRQPEHDFAADFPHPCRDPGERGA